MTPSKSKATIERIRVHGGMLIRIAGVLDETLHSEEIAAGSHGVVVIDLEGVKKVTSFGIREWLRVLQQLTADYYCFVNVPAVMVSQLTMVTGLAGAGEVISFHLPYLCSQCDSASSVVLDLRRADHRELVSALRTPHHLCPACGEESEFDDHPELYYQYFQTAPSPNPGQLANAIIDGKDTGQPFQIRKEITDLVTALWISGAINRASYFKRIADGLQGHILLVLTEVDSVNEQGLSGFVKFLATAPEPYYLARVPLSLLVPLSRHSRAIGPAQLVSVSMSCYCPSCDNHVATEIGMRALQDFARQGELEAYCNVCAHAVNAPVTADWLDAASRLPCADPPLALIEYLAVRRFQGPAQTGDTSFMGNELAGRYQIQRRIGRGGMGEIYLARQIGPGGFKKPVVIKRIAPERFKSLHAVEQFLQEARLSARLSHPNIVQIFELGRSGGEYFQAIEYVDGLDLRAIITVCRQAGILIPIAICCRIVHDLCGALQAAHSHRDDSGAPSPIVHRDVSPGNVLISSDGVVKLTDFGIAKASAGLVETEPGVIKGTMRFIPPESLDSTTRSVHPRIDIYGAGVLLYESLTCKPLFTGMTWVHTLQEIVSKPLPKLSSERPDVTPHLERTFERAVARDPGQRHETIVEFRDDVQKASEELEASASIEDLARWLRLIRERQQLLASLSTDQLPGQERTMTTRSDRDVNSADGVKSG